jgi:D-glutamate cyclase-like protein
VGEERENLRLLVQAGFVDGITKAADLVVDGMPFDGHHRAVLTAIRRCVAAHDGVAVADTDT